MQDSPRESRRAAATLAEEFDAPLYYHIPTITQGLHSGSVPIADIIGMLISKGHNASRTQIDDNGIKTDADAGTLKGIVKRLAGGKQYRPGL
jgi:tRNA G26 N,N-dimethylase Trm1